MLGGAAAADRPTDSPTDSPTDKAADGPAYGTYLRPFAADSLWNSRPVNPVLGSFRIPKSTYFPAVASGAYSTGVFLAKPDDAPVTIVGPPGKQGVWDPDAEMFRASITLPHWPVVMPARGSDGHAEVVDEQLGVIHSFWQLRNDNGTWRAAQYAWTRLDGRGWGDPANYFQGARATGVPSSAGLIRIHEIDDGDTQYRHALAMSLTFNGLAAKPAYVFPATSADSGAETQNTGQIPEGALMLLPADFDLNRITTPRLRKVAATLKTYGAYVVDRNVGTPFGIYVENGARYALTPGVVWSNTAANELDLIRVSLRQVISADSWEAADGRTFQPRRQLNLIALRGAWNRRSGGDASAAYDSAQRALVVTASAEATTLQNVSNRLLTLAHWARPKAGDACELTVKASGGATLKLDLVAGGKVVYSSGALNDGQRAVFPWPANDVVTVGEVTTAPGRAAVVSASLMAQP
jgi:hypothetical protein